MLSRSTTTRGDFAHVLYLCHALHREQCALWKSLKNKQTKNPALNIINIVYYKSVLYYKENLNTTNSNVTGIYSFRVLY